MGYPERVRVRANDTHWVALDAMDVAFSSKNRSLFPDEHLLTIRRAFRGPDIQMQMAFGAMYPTPESRDN